MKPEIDAKTIDRMLRCAAARIRESRDELSRLDSHGGDGDHGTTMCRAVDQVENALDSSPGPGTKTMLHDVGWAVMGVDGGATGPLFGTLFMAMSEAAGDEDAFDASGLAALFEAGLEGVRKRTRARVGDKTMIDALEPAVRALRAAADDGADAPAALLRAAEAAEEGARSTVDLAARFGRAKNLGEKSKGSRDPGAASVSLIFKGFSEGVESSA
jgi:dihydroxyacetone kinase-like protein